MKLPKEKKVSSSEAATGYDRATNDTGSGFRLNQGLQLLIVVLFGVAAYANTFHLPFNFDDQSSIVGNPIIKNLSNFLSSSAGYNYNPRRFVGYLSLAVNYRIGELSPFGYHLFNLLVHTVCALLVYRLTFLTFRTPRLSEIGVGWREGAAFLAALLFVTHPVQTESVTYIVQRMTSLAALFYLLTVVSYVQGRLVRERENKRGGGSGLSVREASWYVLALLAAAAAVRTKEITATLPLTILLYELSFFENSTRKKRAIAAGLIGMVVVALVGIALSSDSLSAFLSEVSEKTKETSSFSRGDYLLTQFGVIVTYLRLLVLPIGQNLDYDYPIYHSLFEPTVLFSFVLLSAILGLALYLIPLSRRWNRPQLCLVTFGIFWFFITLSVESSIIPIEDVIFEHRLYLPSFGIFLAAAGALALLPRLTPGKYLAVSLVLACLLGGATWNRNRAWENPITIWSDAAAKSPNKARTHYNLGMALLEAGKTDEAIEELETALRLKPKYTTALAHTHLLLGTAYGKKGNYDQAIRHLEPAVQMGPEDSKARYTLATAYEKTGRMDEAIKQYVIITAAKPEEEDAHYNLALAYGRKGRIAEAIRELETAQRIRPDDAEVINSLGIAYIQARQIRPALESFRRACTLNPQNSEYRENLARASALAASIP